MKISKTLAVLVAITIITAMSGVTAFAAITNVATTTTYDWDDTENPGVTITSVVTASEDDVDDQVTYLVANGADIKYIDQQPIDEDGEATFTFSAKNNDIFGATVEAKFGTDVEGENIPMPTFSFANGVDYFTTADVAFEEIQVPAELAPELADYNKYVVAQITAGDVEAYGAELTIDEKTQELAAYGTVNGIFCVALNVDKPERVKSLKAFAR